MEKSRSGRGPLPHWLAGVRERERGGQAAIAFTCAQPTRPQRHLASTRMRAVLPVCRSGFTCKCIVLGE